jgi:hypothetical protein
MPGFSLQKIFSDAPLIASGQAPGSHWEIP